MATEGTTAGTEDGERTQGLGAEVSSAGAGPGWAGEEEWVGLEVAEAGRQAEREPLPDLEGRDGGEGDQNSEEASVILAEFSVHEYRIFLFFCYVYLRSNYVCFCNVIFNSVFLWKLQINVPIINFYPAGNV